MSEKNKNDDGAAVVSASAPDEFEPDDEYNSELPPHTIDNLAAALPESFSGSADIVGDAQRDPGSAARPAASTSGESGFGGSSPITHTIEISAAMLAMGEPVTASAAAAAALSVTTALAPVSGSGEVSARLDRRERPSHEFEEIPEESSTLTSERLLYVSRRGRRAPRGLWNRLVYEVTLHGVNLGDSAKYVAEDELTESIRKPFDGGTRFVPVLTRKGGVGKTTVTTLLGMALADARDDRVIAVDANPDRGTLSERVARQTRFTVRDVVTRAATIGGFTDFSTLVSRDKTRLDILASDTDPLLSEAFDENDYNVVADLTARFYSIVLTDCGTGIVHSVMRATLQRADSVVIVSGASIDEARLASETLTWLEANGYGELVKNAVVAVNTATQGTNLVKLEEIETHFRSRVRAVVRIPYDPQLAAGSVVSFPDLQPLTRLAARTLAALVVEGLPAERA